MNILEIIKRILFDLSKPYEEADDSYEEEEVKQSNRYPNNYLKYPNHIFTPEKAVVHDDTYTVYKARFNSLQSLYYYLKDKPKVNKTVFSELSSVTGSKSFAGKPYAKAVEDLMAYESPEYLEFLQFQREFSSALKGSVHRYQTVKTVAGGHLNVPAYSAGDPLCFETEEKITRPKFIKINTTLSYPAFTEKKQVINRALIIASLIKSLENAGYSVDLDTFELSSEYDELCHIIVQIKRHGQKTNMLALYKSLCNVEFLRRLLFRILETLDVTNNWQWGYGSTCDKQFVQDYLHLKEGDIYFDTPSSMGIVGDSLPDDFEAAVKNLGLEDTIDMDKSLDALRRIRKQ